MPSLRPSVPNDLTFDKFIDRSALLISIRVPSYRTYAFVISDIRLPVRLSDCSERCCWAAAAWFVVLVIVFQRVTVSIMKCLIDESVVSLICGFIVVDNGKLTNSN